MDGCLCVKYGCLVCANNSRAGRQDMLSIFVYLLTEGLRYAESWDFEVSASSFLQFDLSMGCSKAVTPTHNVHLEFSTDCGNHWTLVTSECIPPAIGCARYTQSSIYSTPQYSQWRRVTVYLPSAAKYAIYTFLNMS